MKNCKIQNQRGHGMVIEAGHGELENVTIQHCDRSGILADAPLKITQCCISHVQSGLTICEHVKGNIVMKDNKITNCSTQIFRQGPNAIYPTVIGTEHEVKSFSLPTNISKREYRKFKESMDWQNPPSEPREPKHDMDKNSQLRCCACTILILDASIRTRCGREWYCSRPCLELRKDDHAKICWICDK